MASNPIVPGFNPDPSICRVGSDYYLATSTFEYFPGVPIYHSKDLVNWKMIGHALNRPSQLYMRTEVAGAGIFAPTLRYWKGRWYMTTCCIRVRKNGVHDEIRGFIVSTDDIWDDSQWTDPLPIDVVGIDQDLFFDDDDKVYLCASRLGEQYGGGPRQPAGALLTTYGAQIDLKTGRNLTRPVMLRDSDQVNRIAEGPHMYKRNGWYYLMIAEGGTEENHQEWIFRSKSPLGPYEHPPAGINPLVHNGLDGGDVMCTGHADMFEGADGRWWVVMLATRPQGEGRVAQLGRETFLSPVEWTEDGWPVFNGREKIGLTVKGIKEGPKPTEWSDDFSSDKLSIGWYSVRTPVRQDYSFGERPNTLTLYGNPFRIDQLESPALLCRKQQYHSGTWRTVLDFKPDSEYDEAGTAVFWSNYSFIAMVIRKKGEGRELVLRWNAYEDDKRQEVSTPLSTSSGPIILGLTAAPTSYTPFYQESTADKPTTLQTLNSNVVCRNKIWDSPFTGTHFALFAQGADGESCLTPAHFGRTSFSPGS